MCQAQGTEMNKTYVFTHRCSMESHVHSGTFVITVCLFRKPLQGPFLPSNDYRLMSTYYMLCVWSLISMPNNNLTRRQDTSVIY